MLLPTEDRARLREYLMERFSLGDLKNLAFDLNISYELLQYDNMQDFPRELILFLERKGRLACLVLEMLKYLQDNYLNRLVAILPPCQPSKKVQIIINQDLLTDRELNLLINQIAALAKVNRNEIDIIAAAWGSTRYLIGISRDIGLISSEIIAHRGSMTIRADIRDYDSLYDTHRATWKYIAVNHPPKIFDGIPVPDVNWNDAFTAASRGMK